MNQIMGSMELPRVVNVEDLQRNNLVNIDDAFSERDLEKFLDHLKDAGVAVGNYSDGVLSESTYYVTGGDGFTPVERLSLEDEGIKKAISRCKSVQPAFGFHFSYKKEMTGVLSVFRVKVNEETVYEEPGLVTEDGVLVYQGIIDLVPSFTDTYSSIRFKSLEKYKAELEKTWFEKTQEKYNEKLDFMGQLINEESDPIRKKGLIFEFKKMRDEIPQSCSVEEGAEICRVEFKSEIAWIGNEEVELFGMQKATEYYESNGYKVTDVHFDTYKGYDIECRRGNNILRVEVKGLRGSRYPLMTPNEHSKAVLYRESFILFIVRMGLNDDYTMYSIPDPVFNEVDITPIMKPVYQVKGFNAFQIQ
jgi:hypothetical protein